MSARYTALSGETLIHLHGTDIPGFLQGQLTADLRQLDARRAVAGALCNPKGRVLADLRVIAIDATHCVLALRESIAEACLDTLTTYARFSRIECALDDGAHAIVGLWGEQAAAQLDALGVTAPETTWGVTRTGERICLRGPGDMYQLIAPAAAGEGLRCALADSNAATEEHWQAAELSAGIYRIETADWGQFTPQALNLDLAGYVSFKKGCYTGQEVVARLHYRGQSKRRLAVFEATGLPRAPSREAPLVDASGASVGSVLRCATDADNRLLIAAGVRADLPMNAVVHLETDGHASLQRLPLAYAAGD